MAFTVVLLGVNRLTTGSTLKRIRTKNVKPVRVGFTVYEDRLAAFVNFESELMALRIGEKYQGKMVDGHAINTRIIENYV